MPYKALYGTYLISHAGQLNKHVNFLSKKRMTIFVEHIFFYL